MRRAMVIYNPAAGRYPALSAVKRALPALAQGGWDIRLEQAQNADHLTDLARQAASEGMEAVFVVGGDGSLNLALPGLLGTRTALGVLPAGTANVWAQELGLPIPSWTNWTATEDSALRLADAAIHAVDVGLCNGRPFLLWAGVGLDAFIVHQIEPRTRWEKGFATVGYAASSVWSATQYHGTEMTITADGKKVSGRFLVAVTSNVHLYAGGLAELSPQSRLDDRRMELWLFEGESFADALQRAWDLLAGQHVHSDQVTCISFETVTIEAQTALPVQVDGEPAHESQQVHIEILPKALHVLAPQHVPHILFVENE